VDYDASGSIGRRYRRNDEVGTPYCVTIDYETIENRTVTIRERDSMRQVKVEVEQLRSILEGLLASDREFDDAGAPVCPAKEQ
jgi:glycyl-tRNA synthetase